MKNSKPQPPKHSKRGARQARQLVIALGAMLLTILALSSLFVTTKKPMSTHEKAEALGIIGAPPEIERRHVEITENPPPVGPEGDINVHIMFRTNNHSSWQFRGTGTIKGKTPSMIFTAYHNLENHPGQYGSRKIGPDELSGKEKIFPIVSYIKSPTGDDTIICVVSTNHFDFPEITVPIATNVFQDFERDKGYKVTPWPAKVHFKTYPDKTIQNLLTVEVMPGTFHFIMDYDPLPGESGTMASVEGEKTNTFLVVIREQLIPRIVIDHLTPAQMMGSRWTETKPYGVAVLVRID